MPNQLHVLLLIAITAFLLGCEVTATSNRSGNSKDDYVEEPLSKLSKRFEPSLEASNLFIDYLQEGDFESIHRDLLAPELQENLPLDELKRTLSNATSAAGNVVQYKRMQWGFIHFSREGRSFVGSTKLVEHEKGMMKYLIIFDKNGGLDRVVGFQFKQRDGVSPVGEF